MIVDVRLPLEHGNLEFPSPHRPGVSERPKVGDEAGFARELAPRQWRQGRVELEGAPDQLHVVGVGKIGQGRLQPSLPEVAERADDVTPDLDAHAGPNAVRDSDVPNEPAQG